MKNKELKTIWKLATNVWVTTTLFWIIETGIFLIIEGWHLKATNPIEIYCDKIVSHGWLFASNLTIVTCVCSLTNLRKNNN